MKNKFFSLIAIIVLALTVTSCYSSRKSKTGCPVNVKVTPGQATDKHTA